MSRNSLMAFTVLCFSVAVQAQVKPRAAVTPAVRFTPSATELIKVSDIEGSVDFDGECDANFSMTNEWVVSFTHVAAKVSLVVGGVETGSSIVEIGRIAPLEKLNWITPCPVQMSGREPAKIRVVILSGKEDATEVAALRREIAQRKSDDRALAAVRKRKAEEQKRLRDTCSLIFRVTADKKISNLTVRETQQIEACRALGMYR